MKKGVAVLFFKKNNKVDEVVVNEWFEADYAAVVDPIRENIGDFDFTIDLADALFFSGYNVEKAIVIINANETGFLFAKNSGLFDDFYFITSDQQITDLKNWGKNINLAEFVYSFRY